MLKISVDPISKRLHVAVKSNPYHDEQGKFAEGPGGTSQEQRGSGIGETEYQMLHTVQTETAGMFSSKDTITAKELHKTQRNGPMVNGFGPKPITRGAYNRAVLTRDEVQSNVLEMKNRGLLEQVGPDKGLDTEYKLSDQGKASVGMWRDNHGIK